MEFIIASFQIALAVFIFYLTLILAIIMLVAIYGFAEAYIFPLVVSGYEVAAEAAQATAETVSEVSSNVADWVADKYFSAKAFIVGENDRPVMAKDLSEAAEVVVGEYIPAAAV